MKGDHFVAFGIGVLVGWLVLPMLLSAVSGSKTA